MNPASDIDTSTHGGNEPDPTAETRWILPPNGRRGERPPTSREVTLMNRPKKQRKAFRP